MGLVKDEEIRGFREAIARTPNSTSVIDDFLKVIEVGEEHPDFGVFLRELLPIQFAYQFSQTHSAALLPQQYSSSHARVYTEALVQSAYEYAEDRLEDKELESLRQFLTTVPDKFLYSVSYSCALALLESDSSVRSAEAVIARLLNVDSLAVQDAMEASCVNPLELLSGQQLGRFAIQEQAGKGAGGVVYRASETFSAGVTRQVALKFLYNSDPASVHNELDTLVNAPFNGLVTLYAIETISIPHSGEAACLVMKWIDGEPIDGYVARRSLSLDAILDLFGKLCTAVGTMHANDRVHRDLKPQNILCHLGEVTVLDFGLAFDRTNVVSLRPAGTPDYASPEQYTGLVVDYRADVFSLGVLLFELLEGHRPFSVAVLPPQDRAKFMEHLSDSDRTANTSMPELLRNIVARCLSVEAESRPASAVVLAEEIRHIKNELSLRPLVSARMEKLAIKGGIACLSALCAILWFSFLGTREKNTEGFQALARIEQRLVSLTQVESLRESKNELGVIRDPTWNVRNLKNRVRTLREQVRLAHGDISRLEELEKDVIITEAMSLNAIGQHNQAVRLIEGYGDEFFKQSQHAPVLAESLFQLQRWSEAEAYFRMADPDSLVSVDVRDFRLASICAAMGRRDDAIQQFRELGRRFRKKIEERGQLLHVGFYAIAEGHVALATANSGDISGGIDALRSALGFLEAQVNVINGPSTVRIASAEMYNQLAKMLMRNAEYQASTACVDKALFLWNSLPLEDRFRASVYQLKSDATNVSIQIDLESNKTASAYKAAKQQHADVQAMHSNDREFLGLLCSSKVVLGLCALKSDQREEALLLAQQSLTLQEQKSPAESDNWRDREFKAQLLVAMVSEANGEEQAAELYWKAILIRTLECAGVTRLEDANEASLNNLRGLHSLPAASIEEVASCLHNTGNHFAKRRDFRLAAVAFRAATEVREEIGNMNRWPEKSVTEYGDSCFFGTVMFAYADDFSEAERLKAKLVSVVGLAETRQFSREIIDRLTARVSQANNAINGLKWNKHN